MRCATSATTASEIYPTSSCAYSSMGTSAERRSGYSVTSLSKRAASLGEKIEFAISLTQHHLPRQLFSGKVHLFHFVVQPDRPIRFQREGRSVAPAVFHSLVGKARPSVSDAQDNLIRPYFHH